MYGLSGATTVITVSYVGGPLFIFAAFLLGIVYWNGKYWKKKLQLYLLLLTLHSL